MKRITFYAALIIAISTLTGCATSKNMAFHDDKETLAEKKNPVLLMTTTLRNDYKTSFQPDLIIVYVEKPGAKEKADRFNFEMDDKGTIGTGSADKGNTYLLRMEVPPGSYDIVGMMSTSNHFPIFGNFFTPLHSHVEVKDSGVYYLGHVEATVRERHGDEFRAGGTLPLIDQSVAGASGGTFDVAITDHFTADSAAFREKFPPLKTAKINKVILPPFDRAKAQAWWEGH